ncbi:MAG: L,D-transpeptidase family protein [Anaerolineae bacterium]|nr:L,D-transpeptidase family protein [Anaerolineae bacterium]
MSDEAANVKKKLHLGIEAVRAGQKNIARVHLNAVLQLDPNNVPALLWLAYVSLSPQESIGYLKRALELDPTNERARSGLRWAETRLNQASVETSPTPAPVTLETQETVVASQPISAESQPVVVDEEPGEETPATETEEDTIPPADAEALRQKLLPSDAQEQAKKGALAHRARRTIDPLATILIVLSALLSVAALGLGALIFVPADTLAAWLPVSELTPAPVDSGQASRLVVEAPSPTPPLSSLAHQGDTVLINVVPPVGLEVDEPVPPTAAPIAEAAGVSMVTTATVEPVPTVEAMVPLILPETNLVPVEPLFLIGPERLVNEPEVSSPDVLAAEALPPSPASDNFLLAHQPAYPGEKWIEVNVTTQQVIAWEGDTPVFSYIASTGLPNTPTILGEYRIYWKLSATLMVGPGYYLPDVPYTMYFYKGYALHGTYWHSNFGQPMSHGCVNLETGNAKQLFEWADPVLSPGQIQVTATAANPGTLVVVHQ